jgi:transposase
MLDMRDSARLQVSDLQGLNAEAAQAVLEQLQRQAREIAFKDAKLQKLTFELARHRAWRFGAKSEAMSAEQRRLFEETLAEDEAALQALLRTLRTPADEPDASKDRRRPRREKLPEHLPRVEHRHEPADTNCPAPACGQPMTRIGEDVSERLDIVPAQFFVQRHIYGKWSCRCCQQKGEGRLVQEPALSQIIDGGVPAAGLLAHTLISRFIDHLPYYRQEAINARGGVHTPRSTLAQWSGQAGAALEPLYEAHKRFVLAASVLHADETPVAMLDPGAGKTKRAYVWAYARGAFDAQRGVIYEFCAGRGAQHPIAFLQQGPPAQDGQHKPWRGTLVRDEYAAYDSVLDAKTSPGRIGAGCLAHARRKFDELIGSGASPSASPVATDAIRRIAEIYRVERELAEHSVQERLAARRELSKPLWQELKSFLMLERERVAEGGSTAKAIDYSLSHWRALTHHLDDGAVAVDNNSLENLIRPWAMGRKAWLFAGSQLAGQRAAIVMSLVQSAKLNAHDPWAYLRDVITRLPTQLNRRIDELLPHRWTPAR